MRPDGKVASIFARGQIRYDKTGEPVRIIGIVQAVSKRKPPKEVMPP